MDGEELGGTFVISVDELGLNGLWSTIKDLVESRMPLQGLTLPNKVGKIVAVPRLPLMFVVSTDKRLLRLKQYSHSPVTWFRNPHTHLILVSTADVHEYKSTTRAQLKRVTADVEKDWGGAAVGSEWLILYVRPFELEPSDKGAKKVFEKLCDDFASKRRERVVRLDVPLRAFDAPTASSTSSQSASSRLTSAGYTPLQTNSAPPGLTGQGGTGAANSGAVWGFGATGLDELAAGLRDSIRAAFEARQAAYDAEVRRLLNERREPKWSFTTLYLVKDSFALMLEGAGLWEDAFQEYVELETVYLDCLETTAAAAAAAPATPAEAAAAAVRDAADFGLTGSDTEDVASLLSSSWRNMRRLVLWKKSVQEFHFRQYLFAAQARVLLRLGRPVDVAERGLVFVQNFLAILAAREAAGQVKPWFKECWAFSACMSLISAITAYTAQRHSLPPDWEVTDLLSSGSSPQGPAAAAAVRQLAAVAAAERAEKAAAGSEGKAGSTRRITEGDRSTRGRVSSVPGSPPQLSIVTNSSSSSSTPAGSSSSSNVPVLTGAEWELEYPREGLKGAAAAAAAAAEHDTEDDVPPLDMTVLCGQAITPGNAGLLLAGEQRKELTDKLHNCLLGHLYHLARGELLRLGSALGLLEAAAAAAGGARILQLGKSAFAPPPAAAARSSTAAAAANDRPPGGSSSSNTASLTPRSKVSAHGGASATAAAAAAAGQNQASRPLSSGVDLLSAAAAAGSLSPRIVAQLQELLTTPLCGFSQMINKYADGSGEGLTYEVHTPKLSEGPLATALARHNSQSTTTGALQAYNSANLGSSSSSIAVPSSPPPAAAAGGGGSTGSSTMFDRLRRATSGGSIAAGQQQQQQPAAAANQSRLSKVSGEEESTAAAAAGSSSNLARADSGTSLATVNISSGGDAPPTAAAAANELAAAAAAAGNGSSDTGSNVADSASSLPPPPAAAAADDSLHGPVNSVAGVPSLAANTGSLSGASGQALRDLAGLPKVATHTRSVSALPSGAAGSGGAAAAAGSSGMIGHMISPRRLEGLVDPGAMVPSGSSVLQRAAAAATGGLSLVHPAAAAAAAAGVPTWVGEWRLQMALRSPAAFQELLLALSRRAARCYAKAGRVRSSALIYADVAVMALQRGQLEQAARLLNRMQQIFSSEGWQLLLGSLLPKLLAVQRLAAQPLLPFTALAVLSLPPGAAAAADRQAAYEELLSAIGALQTLDQITTGALKPQIHNLSPDQNPNGVYEGPRGLQSSPMLGFIQQQQQQQQQQQVVQLATNAAIGLRPAAGTYSHFFGSEAPDYAAAAAAGQQQQMVPLLSPPARPPAAAAAAAAGLPAAAAGVSSQGAAALLVVGDSLNLAVDVVSRLPGPVSLRRLVLSLVQLHKSAWYSSMGGNSIFGAADAVSMSGAAAASSSSTGINLLALDQQGFSGVKEGIGFRATAAAAAGLGFSSSGVFGSSDSPRVSVQKWQEGEQLVSNKLVTAFSPSGTSGDIAAAAAGSSGSSCCQLLSDGSVLLVPGINRLVFQIAPVRKGLYCLKQLRALLGSSAELVVGLPPPGSLSLLAAAAAASRRKQRQQQHDLHDQIYSGSELLLSGSSGSTGSTAAAAAVQIGGVTASGSVVSEVVVARVTGPSPRLNITHVVPNGFLPVGCTAWLGVLITPLHDVTLRRPRLHVLPSKLISFATTAGPRDLGGTSFQGFSNLQQQQQQQGLVAPSGGLGSSIETLGDHPQQQQQLVHPGLTAADPAAAGSSSGSSVFASSTNVSISFGGAGGIQTHSQSGHWVYVQQLQQQQQQDGQFAAAAAGSGDPAAAAGRWLRVSRGGGVDLSEVLGPDAMLNSPLLLWMQVAVGGPTFPPATVKVTLPPAPQPITAATAATLSSRHSIGSTAEALQHQGSLPQTPAAAAAAGGPLKCIPETAVLLASRPSSAAAELALQVEYSSGVWRSHVCSLQPPLQQPAAVAAAAMQLPGGVIALNITVSLDPDAGFSLLLLEAGFRPQYGLVLGSGSSSSGFGSSSSSLAGSGFGDVLPLRVLPGGSAGLCYLLARDSGDKSTGSFEADGSSLLLLNYALEPANQQSQVTNPITGGPLPQPPAALGQDPAAPAAAAAAGDSSSSNAGGGIQQQLASILPPLAPASAAAEAVAAGRVTSLRLPFWLEFPSSIQSAAAAAAACLKAILLGPFTGRIGQPMILTWQLSRTGPDSGSGADHQDSGGFQGFSNISLNDHQGLGSTSVGSVSTRFSSDGYGDGAVGSVSSDSDEVLLYEVTPGFSGQPEQGLRSSSLGLGGLATPARAGGSVGQGLAHLNRGQTLNPNEGLVWWEGCNLTGSVRLGRVLGSLATVEVVLVPLLAGRQVAPQLSIRSLGGNQPLAVEGPGVAGLDEDGSIYIQP